MILLTEIMDKTNRAIDNGDVRVIIEAAAEFEQGVADFKKGLDAVLQISNINPTKLSSLANIVKQAQSSIKNVKTNKLPNSFSFKQAMALRTGKGDKETNVTPIALAASKVSTAVEGTKEAILVIAEWMEGYSDIFGISSAGIEIKAPFEKNLSEVSLASIAGKSGLEIAKLFAGSEMGKDAQDEEGNPVTDEQEQVYAHFKQGIDALAEKTKKEPLEATSEFLSSLESMGKGLAGVHQTCVKSISEIEVDDGVQQIVRGQGWFKKLFSGTDDYKVSPKEAANICGKSEKDSSTGLFSLSMEQLSQVVQGLIEISGDVMEKSTSAIEGVAQQGDQVLDPNPKQEEAMEDASEVLGDKNKAGDYIARLEDEDLVDAENPDIGTVPREKIESVLTDMDVNDDAKDEIVDKLTDEEAPEDEETSKVKEFKKSDWAGFFGKGGESNIGDGAGQVIGRALEDLGFLKLTESLDLLNEGFIEDVIAKVEEYNDIDEKLKKAVLKKLKKQGSISWIKDKIELQESFRLIDRWGQLAGIIKG